MGLYGESGLKDVPEPAPTTRANGSSVVIGGGNRSLRDISDDTHGLTTSAPYETSMTGPCSRKASGTKRLNADNYAATVQEIGGSIPRGTKSLQAASNLDLDSDDEDTGPGLDGSVRKSKSSTGVAAIVVKHEHKPSLVVENAAASSFNEPDAPPEQTSGHEVSFHKSSDYNLFSKKDGNDNAYGGKSVKTINNNNYTNNNNKSVRTPTNNATSKFSNGDKPLSSATYEIDNMYFKLIDDNNNKNNTAPDSCSSPTTRPSAKIPNLGITDSASENFTSSQPKGATCERTYKSILSTPKKLSLENAGNKPNEKFSKSWTEKVSSDEGESSSCDLTSMSMWERSPSPNIFSPQLPPRSVFPDRRLTKSRDETAGPTLNRLNPIVNNAKGASRSSTDVFKQGTSASSRTPLSSSSVRGEDRESLSRSTDTAHRGVSPSPNRLQRQVSPSPPKRAEDGPSSLTFLTRPGIGSTVGNVGSAREASPSPTHLSPETRASPRSARGKSPGPGRSALKNEKNYAALSTNRGSARRLTGIGKSGQPARKSSLSKQQLMGGGAPSVSDRLNINPTWSFRSFSTELRSREPTLASSVRRTSSPPLPTVANIAVTPWDPDANNAEKYSTLSTLFPIRPTGQTDRNNSGASPSGRRQVTYK